MLKFVEPVLKLMWKKKLFIKAPKYRLLSTGEKEGMRGFKTIN